MAPLPLAETPVNVPLTEEVHVYVVPGVIDEVGVKFKAVPLHIVWLKDDAVLVIVGRGLTFTITSTKFPAQPLAVGVIRYVTVPAVVPVVDVKAWLIVAPLPAPAPVTLLELCTVQVKVVPATLFGLVIAIEVVSPEQIPTGDDTAAVGIGRTVTT